jgi:hypothetical protein
VIDTWVFCNRDSLPGIGEWEKLVRDAGFDLKLLPVQSDISAEPVFVPSMFEGLESGFDVCITPCALENWNLSPEEMEKLSVYDSTLQFSTYSNAQEIAGSVVVMGALAKFSSGIIVDDFFEGRLILSDEAVTWASNRLPNARSQFNGPSKIRKELSGD